MKPVRLDMQAFGPYRERETVEFGELGLNRVFLIHGDTGAGKTTILDAMVFALYGDTSGGDRQAAQMRCESASPSVPTEVVLDFALGSRKFRVARRPGQEITGARGKPVSKPAEVVLWDRSGCGEAEEGRLLTTKIMEANTLIKETLGFSCEQFRQVVVLPQGRFRELLSAGSDKREEILRQLFKTARFRELEEALAERAKTVRAQMQELKAQREAQLGLVDAADDDELAALKAAAASALKAAEAEAEESGGVSLAAGEALAAAEAAEEARRALAAARADFEGLEARAREFAAIRLRLETAVRAERVQSTAERLVEARARVAETTAAADAAAAELTAAEEAERLAAEVLAAERGRTGEREAAAQEVRRLEGLTAAISAWREAVEEATGAASRAMAARSAADAATGAKTAADERLAGLRDEVSGTKAAAMLAEAAQTRLDAARQHEERCRRLLAARDAVEAAEEWHMRCAAAESDAREAVTNAEAALAALEERWRAGRAAALASALAPGRPCPVCGATDHPSPAVSEKGDVTDDELGAARVAVDASRAAHFAARDGTGEAKNRLTEAATAERGISLEPGARPDLQLSDAAAETAVCRAELEALSAQAEVGDAEARMAEAEAAAEAARTAAGAAHETHASAERALAAVEARLSERAAAVPEILRAPGALETAIEEARKAGRMLEEAFEAAQLRALETKEARIARQSDAAAAVVNRAGAVKQERSSAAAFAAALEKQGFAAEEEWRASLLSEEERKRLAADLAAYEEALNEARGRLRQAQLVVAARPEPGDIAGLRSVAEQARWAHTEAIARRERAHNRLEGLLKVERVLREIDGRTENVRSLYQTVGVLADVANGANPNRVSFQRWALGVYLDEVLVNASRKLFLMSKGRYRLQRQKEAAGRGRASGLDLAVFDEYSGSARPAVTLSGGESFLAALALALGLAETVQEHAAGVPLETIFVDEGFGALDSDALELAIDALMELQLGGRLVGVISHVPELRQVIPARLEVRGGPGGSHTRFVVP